jgi:uncharacterized membrane protein
MAPLPPPESLAAYEQVMPGAADRVFKMAEQQAIHRQGLERTKLERDGRAQTRGQYLTAALAAVLFAGSIWLISTGKDVAGLVVVIAETVGLVSVYMYGKRAQRKELETKVPGPR